MKFSKPVPRSLGGRTISSRSTRKTRYAAIKKKMVATEIQGEGAGDYKKTAGGYPVKNEAMDLNNKTWEKEKKKEKNI